MNRRGEDKYVRRVARGGSVVDLGVFSLLVNRRRSRGPLDKSSERERDVLALMDEGRSNQAICERLFITPKTVGPTVPASSPIWSRRPAPGDHRRVLAVLACLRG